VQKLASLKQFALLFGVNPFVSGCVATGGGGKKPFLLRLLVGAGNQLGSYRAV